MENPGASPSWTVPAITTVNSNGNLAFSSLHGKLIDAKAQFYTLDTIEKQKHQNQIPVSQGNSIIRHIYYLAEGGILAKFNKFDGQHIIHHIWVMELRKSKRICIWL
jgi:hypothetical protein